MKIITLLIIPLLIISCMDKPKPAEPITGFELDKYLGKWYEIARLDHRFERGLQNVSADYTLKDDGNVKVVNSGFSTKKNKWKSATGKAKFAKDSSTGFLKVSFFGPFYGSYIIFELDKENYQYAFIAGDNTSYLWFLSRTPTVSDELMDRFIKHAGELGFNTDNLIFVKQNKN
ncbi:lipocalin family protein [bacterium]|nr:lipocalin family protein [bacterium]